MQEITVAAVQMYPVLGKVEDNLIAMTKFVDKICSEQKVDLIVFPELATTGYELGLQFTDVAERVPGHTVNLLAQRAADYGTHIVFGLVSKERVESILYNAAVVIGPDGEILGEYRKLHLPGEERLAFRPGYRLPVFEGSFGLMGVLLGWDLAFPEAARSLALDGAEMRKGPLPLFVAEVECDPGRGGLFEAVSGDQVQVVLDEGLPCGKIRFDGSME
mgnify:CR=1 FL=1